MRRKVMEALCAWRRSHAGGGHLLVHGARGVGKSTIVRAFARAEYPACISIAREGGDRGVFNALLGAPDDPVKALEQAAGHPIIPTRTALVLDEVGAFPRVRDAAAATGCEVIEISSEPRTAGEALRVRPMDFEEFLWAVGDEALAERMRRCFMERRPMGEAAHVKAMERLDAYLRTGGMPEAVEVFAASGDRMLTERIKRRALARWQADIRCSAPGYARKAEALFGALAENAPQQGGRFLLSWIRPDARYRDFARSIAWLEDAGHVGISRECVREDGHWSVVDAHFRAYVGDTGLLFTHSFGGNDERFSEALPALLHGFVAQQLLSSGHELMYHTSRDGGDRVSVDFLLKEEDGLTALMLKTGHYARFTSLRKFKRKYAEDTRTSIMLYNGDVKMEQDILCLPVYMAGLL